MKQNKSYILFCIFVLAGIYLFVSAPPPLKSEVKLSTTIPIQVALKIVDDEHARIRKMYTRDIVGAGSKRGLHFREDWEDENVIAGPLPAQFLRLIAHSLEDSEIPLGLYLASDYAISKSNLLEGEQLFSFKKMKQNNNPVFTYAEDIQRFVYMVPDVAVAKPCVKCHNEHKDSPKTDWKSGDIMGATTWTSPLKSVSYEELFSMLAALNKSVNDAYLQLLAEFKNLPNPPAIGQRWPSEGYFVPELKQFMKKVQSLNAVYTLRAIAKLSNTNSSISLASNE